MRYIIFCCIVFAAAAAGCAALPESEHEDTEPVRCLGTNDDGTPCTRLAPPKRGYCTLHTGQMPGTAGGDAPRPDTPRVARPYRLPAPGFVVGAGQREWHIGAVYFLYADFNATYSGFQPGNEYSLNVGSGFEFNGVREYARFGFGVGPAVEVYKHTVLSSGVDFTWRNYWAEWRNPADGELRYAHNRREFRHGWFAQAFVRVYKDGWIGAGYGNLRGGYLTLMGRFAEIAFVLLWELFKFILENS